MPRWIRSLYCMKLTRRTAAYYQLVSRWVLSSVKSLSQLFWQCVSFSSQNISTDLTDPEWSTIFVVNYHFESIQEVQADFHILGFSNISYAFGFPMASLSFWSRSSTSKAQRCPRTTRGLTWTRWICRSTSGWAMCASVFPTSCVRPPSASPASSTAPRSKCAGLTVSHMRVLFCLLLFLLLCMLLAWCLCPVSCKSVLWSHNSRRGRKSCVLSLECTFHFCIQTHPWFLQT